MSSVRTTPFPIAPSGGPTQTPGHPRPPRTEAGFTVVETLMAMVVLLVGVLGVAMMLFTALEVGRTTRTREAATNLGRELVESARSVRYDQLRTGGADAALQGLGGLGDVDDAPGWQIERRGVRFVVTVEACAYDDPKDGRAAVDPALGACSSPSATLATSTTDLNGDDYRKLTVRVRAGAVDVPLTANVVNPTGGFGPRITTVATRPSADGERVVRVDASADEVEVDVTTTAAASLNWDAGDTRHGGQLGNTGAGTHWSIGWSLGSPPVAGADVCGSPITWTPDAPAYLATFQPFDRSGLPGDLRTTVVAVDRSLPYRVCDVAGGRNPRFGGAVDLQWRASFEGDVVSYRVSRVGPGGQESEVCGDVRGTECVDHAPPDGADDVEYRVRARQQGFALGTALGPAATVGVAPVPADQGAGPDAPAGVTVRSDPTAPRPTVAWTASADPDVVLYRVYRDGTAIDDRIGRVSAGATQLSFVDRDPGGVERTYSVSAVHRSFAESAAVEAEPVGGGS